ncbi:MAG: ABC transporter ATP-binding protein, partial [Candidatus Eremiobacteraeota bacterium]|nr:ABC transporter ATP-binding protein [Candidatus Eremiobacteraeota bacterium]
LTLRGVRRRFGAVQAVDGVDLELQPGEIHALVGENGAGKSTLAAIAYGTVRADEGSVVTNGVVGLVHQHFKLIERLRVWENVLLNREPKRGWAIDVAAARERVRSLASTYGLAVDPDAVVETLPVGIKQRVELLRELDREPSVLLLDEPTAALAPSEIASFFATVTELAKRGTAILVVTHKLAEVIAYSQRVTVMRAGRMVASHVTSATNADEIAREMVGGEVPALAARATTATAPLLEVRGLSARSATSTLANATFDVRAGEIVGVAGIEGNGQTALADALAGVVPFTGELLYEGEPLRPGDPPASRIARGIRVIPQDRRDEALVLDWSVRDNVALGRQRTLALARYGDAAREVIERFDVRPADPDAVVAQLSGGNQQKIVVGRTLTSAPKLVVAYQPTRGIDIGAAALVQSRLIEARNAGAGVLLISFELDEIFACADRVLVIANGAFVGSFDRATIDRGRIGALMAGHT